VVVNRLEMMALLLQIDSEQSIVRPKSLVIIPTHCYVVEMTDKAEEVDPWSWNVNDDIPRRM
jgi:hypothetical protein